MSVVCVSLQLTSPYPYPLDSMLFMDFRDLPPSQSSEDEEAPEVANLPTFLYAMPLSPTRVFFEVCCTSSASPATLPNVVLSRAVQFLEADCRC